MFLAGVSILFQKAKGKSPAALSRFLLTRGLWLIFLEATVISLGFNFGEPFVFLQTIWSIGMGMLCISLISRFSPRTVLVLGVALLALCPLAVPLTAGANGALGVIRTLAIAPGIIPGTPILGFYAFVPWLSVMCLGFGLGPIYRLPTAERSRILLPLALGLRHPDTAVVHGDIEISALARLCLRDARRVDPDLPRARPSARLAGAAVARLRPDAAVHLCRPHLHREQSDACRGNCARDAAGRDLGRGRQPPGGPPIPWGFPLGVVYALWLLVLVLLIPLSHWFAGIKHRRRDWWLSYL